MLEKQKRLLRKNPYGKNMKIADIYSQQMKIGTKWRIGRIIRKRAAAIIKRRNQSDIWLEENWKQLGMFIETGPYKDKVNESFVPYICDLVNTYYRYVIECDDKSHLFKKDYDTERDDFMKNHGYRVFRVEYLDLYELRWIASEVRKMREIKNEHHR